MVSSPAPLPGLPQPFLVPGSSSFTAFLTDYDSSLLPGAGLTRGGLSGGGLSGAGSGMAWRAPGPFDGVPHGTTIVALAFPGGVVMAGDRRATSGNVIAQRDIEKVFEADEHAVVGIAGTAGIALELVRLYQVELEHYEKIEGAALSLEGKANKLASMLRGNLGLAMHGLAVVPLLAGYDPDRELGRIYSYDVTGGRYEEHMFHAIGSGSVFARGSLKKLYKSDLSETAAVTAALEALYDAADDDSATGGPDLARKIYPVIAVVDVDGVRVFTDSQVEPLVQEVVRARQQSPDGPNASLPANTGGPR